jgi:hypothetical protein
LSKSKSLPQGEDLYPYAAEPYGFADESFFRRVTPARGGGS